MFEQLGPLPEFLDRDAVTPVVRVSAPTGDPMWLVTAYDLGRQVLTDPRFSRAAAARPEAPKLNTSNPAPTSLMSMDGADHARLRRLVAGGFAPRRIAALAPAIQQLVDDLLDDVHVAGPPVDLIAAFAMPLPLTVASVLLGIPEQDRDMIRAWAGVLFDVTASSATDKARRGFALFAYMTKLLERKRREPADDVLSDLARAQTAGALTQTEQVDLALALLTAGYETTVGQIGLSILSTLREPRAVVSASTCPHAAAGTGAVPSNRTAVEPSTAAPAAPLGHPTAVEEYLRLTPATPVAFARVAVEDVELGGVTIMAGQAVVVSLLHANRDPAVFSEPHRMLDDPRPAHLTFGHGPHYCLGAPLARLQLDIALRSVAARFPTMYIVAGADAVAWHDGYVTRGLSHLLVGW